MRSDLGDTFSGSASPDCPTMVFYFLKETTCLEDELRPPVLGFLMGLSERQRRDKFRKIGNMCNKGFIAIIYKYPPYSIRKQSQVERENSQIMQAENRKSTKMTCKSLINI